MNKKGYSVKRVKNNNSYVMDLILNKHYAKRRPSISYAFVLYKEKTPIGALTIGKPASHQLCIGVCGEEYAHKVYELNRLITEKVLEKNVLSWFVATVLRSLKEEELIIVSYADTGMGHNGYIYQATNFIFTGTTRQRTDKYTPKGRHSRHYDNSNNHLRKVRTAKHRYIYFTGNKREYKRKLNYTPLPFPKGENEYYILGERQKNTVINTKTNEIFKE